MKLETTIAPRLDGTVRVKGLDAVGRKLPTIFIFEAAGEGGPLVCDVTHEPTLVHLLEMEEYSPHNEEDFDHAQSLLDRAAAERQRAKWKRRAAAMAAADDEEDPDSDDDGLGGEYDEEKVDAKIKGLLPVEANTPPKPAKKLRKAAPAKRTLRRKA